MIKYSIAMGIRLACIFAMLFVQGWWLAVCAAGAIVLPYIAVVIANVGGGGAGGVVERPGGIVPVSGVGRGPGAPGDGSSAASTGEAQGDPSRPGSERMPEDHDDRSAA